MHTVDDVKKLILLNNNETGDPCGGIAPRCDLKKKGKKIKYLYKYEFIKNYFFKKRSTSFWGD